MDCKNCLNYANNQCSIYNGIDTKKWNDCSMKLMPNDMDKAAPENDAIYYRSSGTNYYGRGIRE